MSEEDFGKLLALVERYGYECVLWDMRLTLPKRTYHRDAQALHDKLSELAAWVRDSFNIW